MNDPAENTDADGTLLCSAVIVLAGPHAGRIGVNDDDEFIFEEMFSDRELKLYKKIGVEFRSLEIDDSEKDDCIEASSDEDEFGDISMVGTDCEIVYFGFPNHQDRYYKIPRKLIRPATMHDFINRYGELNELLIERMFVKEATPRPSRTSLLAEFAFIANEIAERELSARNRNGEGQMIFLCHSSKDKPFVRKVAKDLMSQGFNPWLDELEIHVGDSIVEKIGEASGKADAIIVFISATSVVAPWVKREWHSSLARHLSGSAIKFLPALIEEISVPDLISDIKYADFRENYSKGLSDLIRALAADKLEA